MLGKKTSLTTLIGESSNVQGDITTKQSVRVDGIIIGNIIAGSAIIISVSGEAEGDLTCIAGKILIEGKVEGNVIAESIKITSTGKITGRIETSNISIEYGATVNSTIVIKESKD